MSVLRPLRASEGIPSVEIRSALHANVELCAQLLTTCLLPLHIDMNSILQPHPLATVGWYLLDRSRALQRGLVHAGSACPPVVTFKLQ